MISASELMTRIFIDCEQCRMHDMENRDITILMSRGCYEIICTDTYGTWISPEGMTLCGHPIVETEENGVNWYISTRHGEIKEDCIADGPKI